MRKNLFLPALLLIFALGCSAQRPANSPYKKIETQAMPANAADAASAAPVMKELRNRLLTSAPEQVGLGGEDAKAKVWGALMEKGLPIGVSTLVSLRDGTASFYTSSGNGLLGGYNARDEAQEFVAEAEKQLARMQPAKSFPYPEVGRVKFYVLTSGGVYTAEAGSEELEAGRGELSPLFVAGGRVSQRLLEVARRAQPGGAR
jgi:hypothetical protein